jgi:hypothetical protein
VTASRFTRERSEILIGVSGVSDGRRDDDASCGARDDQGDDSAFPQLPVRICCGQRGSASCSHAGDGAANTR